MFSSAMKNLLTYWDFSVLKSKLNVWMHLNFPLAVLPLSNVCFKQVSSYASAEFMETSQRWCAVSSCHRVTLCSLLREYQNHLQNQHHVSKEETLQKWISKEVMSQEKEGFSGLDRLVSIRVLGLSKDQGSIPSTDNGGSHQELQLQPRGSDTL